MMFLNDEWITGNQIYQLDQNHQILYAEGKYGYYENNTPGKYFQERDELLLYSSYLPVLSYPAIILLRIVGESLRFLISSLLSIIIIILGLFIRNTYSEQNSSNISQLLFFLSFILFSLNLWYYQSVPIDIHTSPFEILGVWFFHLGVFILLSMSMYCLSRIIFQDTLFCQLSTISMLTCSSYLFWTMTLKDHIDSVLFFTLILCSVFLYQQTGDSWFFPVSFIFGGLLTWVRPELGLIVCGALLTLLIGFCYQGRWREREKRDFVVLLSAPLFSVIGAFPLLISNYCVTGNPFTVVWQLHQTTSNLSLNSFQNSAISSDTTVQSIIHTAISRITPESLYFVSDIFPILLIPDGLKVPILSLAPLFVLGILFSPAYYYYHRKTLEKDEWISVLILLVFIGFTFLAYGSTIQGMEESRGIYPDFRYLCPVYLPLTLIGLLIIRKTISESESVKRIIRWSFITTILGIPTLIAALDQYYGSMGFWDSFHTINHLFPFVIYCIILMTTISYVLCEKKRFGYSLRDLGISLLVAVPLLWQISLLIVCQMHPSMFTSYPSLIPVIQGFFEIAAGT